MITVQGYAYADAYVPTPAANGASVRRTHIPQEAPFREHGPGTHWSDRINQFEPSGLHNLFGTNLHARSALRQARTRLLELETSVTEELERMIGVHNTHRPAPTDTWTTTGHAHFHHRSVPLVQYRVAYATAAHGHAGRRAQGQANWNYDPQANKSHTTWTDQNGKSWNAVVDHQTGAYTSAANWCSAGNDGTQVRDVMDHKTGIGSQETFNPVTGRHLHFQPFTAPDASGFQHRSVFDYQTGMHWRHSYNPTTRAQLSATGWSAPDQSGRQSRSIYDYQSKRFHRQTFTPDGGAAPLSPHEYLAKVILRSRHQPN